jgi:Late embryogenesis abundant protein
MNTSTLVWGGVIIGGGYLLYKYGGLVLAGNDLQINFSGVDLSNFPTVGVQLQCQNVSNTPIQVNALVGQVSVNGNPLGSINLPAPVTIAALGATNVNMNFSPSLLSLPAAITQVINAQSGQLSFNVTGYANVSGIPAPVPFNVTQSFSV